MSSDEVRKGVTQAKNNQSLANIFFFEIIIISLIFAFSVGHWWVFLVSCVVLVALYKIKVVSGIMSFALAIFWTIIAFKTVNHFSGTIAGVIVAIIAFVVAIGIHQGAKEHLDDL